MKHLLLTAFILFFSASWHCAQGQEIFNFVLEGATRTVNTPSANFTQTRIAQFKRTALLYMKREAFERMSEVTEGFLNTQAYYMSEFLSLFMSELVSGKKTTEEERRERILAFMGASLSHPLFGDDDEETTLAYIKEGTELTPFSLDTNWEEAYQAMTEDKK